jgi:hypothetical protein
LAIFRSSNILANYNFPIIAALAESNMNSDKTDDNAFFHPSHPIEPQTLQRELYWLAAAASASEKLHELSEPRDDDELDTLRIRYEITEISRLLISIAVIIRNMQDSPVPRLIGPNRAARKSRQKEIEVGTLVTDSGKSQLNIRNACNKIIHALYVNFPVAQSDPEKLSHITRKVIIKGKLGKQEWEANIDIINFIRAAYRISW